MNILGFGGDFRLGDDVLTESMTRYHIWMLFSFVFCTFFHHWVSPWIFKYNPCYRDLSKYRQMEWDSRVVSTIHASVVSVLCLVSLLKETQLWANPLSGTSDLAFIALSISIGYFFCDLISMPIYYNLKDLFIFTIHHSSALLAFYLIISHKVGAFFGMYRLTTELSTPFTNQRWFYRTLGYTPNRRRVALVALVFSILFAVTRNFLVFPYWLMVYMIYGSPEHVAASRRLPHLDRFWFTASITLDLLNTYWALMVYPIGYRAAWILYTADWRSDIDRARERLQGRFQNVRRRAMNTQLVTSLRRSASFGRLQRTLSRSHFFVNWDQFSEALSEPEFDGSDSGKDSPEGDIEQTDLTINPLYDDAPGLIFRKVRRYSKSSSSS